MNGSGWDAIAARWEREAYAADVSPVAPPSGSTVFDAIVRACEAAAVPTRTDRLRARWRALRGAQTAEEDVQVPRVRLDVDGDDATESGRSLLPRAGDRSFEGWHDRARWEAARRRARPPRIGLIVNFPELVSRDVWSWAREAMRDLYARVGLNNGSNFSAVFAGDYTRTVMGVHDDPESALHFPLIGRKRIRLWEPEVVAAHPEIAWSQRYDHVLQRSTAIEAGPGGVIYWPSRLWHVGESDGGLVVSLTFGLQLGDPAHLLAAQGDVTDLGAGTHTSTIPFDPKDWQGMAASLPGSLALGRAEHSVAGARVAWLRRLTGGNFDRVPPLAASAPVPPVVRGDPRWPPVWCRLDEQRAAVAVNGHAAIGRWSPELPDRIGQIASGKPFRAGPDALLEWLARAGAFAG